MTRPTPARPTRPRRSKRAAGTLLSLLVVLCLIPACASESAPGHASGEVVLYTSMPDSVVERLQGVVERRFPDLEGNYWLPAEGEGITLRVVRGRTADIQELIAEDLAAQGGIQADVIWLAEPSPYETYKNEGLLAPLEPPPDAPIPSEYIDPDGFYVAGRVISMVIAWNTRLNREGFTDWPDLLGADDTAFPAPDSGAARATIKALLDEYGRQFFITHDLRGGDSVPSNGAALDGLVAGRYEAVAVLDYMARQAQAEGHTIDYAYPSAGTVLIPSPIAITANAENPDAAREFVDFILSQPGQEIVVQIGSFYPVRDDVDVPAGAPPLDTILRFDDPWATLADEIDQIHAFWESCYYGNRRS